MTVVTNNQGINVFTTSTTLSANVVDMASSSVDRLQNLTKALLQVPKDEADEIHRDHQ